LDVVLDRVLVLHERGDGFGGDFLALPFQPIGQRLALAAASGQEQQGGGGGTGSGFVPPSRQVVQVGQSIIEPHLDGRLAVVADGERGPVAGYVHRRMLGRVGEGELHRARNRALGAERCTGLAANLECHSFQPS
jgi:hypothetical protein